MRRSRDPVTCLCLDEWRRSSWSFLLRLIVVLGIGEARKVESSGQSRRGLLPNETRKDETGPGSVRGEANGEGQPVARIPAVDHKQCSQVLSSTNW